MKYLKIFENAPAIGNSMVKFTSKIDRLEAVKNEINSFLSQVGDKQIGFNYATGSKGIYMTNTSNELVDDNGYACTTYSELLSNLESILYLLKNLNSNNVVNVPEPIAEPTPSPDGEVAKPLPVEIPVVQSVTVKKFDDGFRF